MREKFAILFGVFALGTITGMATTIKLYERYIFKPLINGLCQATNEESEEESNGAHDERA